MRSHPLYLASASPRRLELLRAIGFEPVTIVPECDEAVRPGEAPQAMVARLAEAKARSAAARLHEARASWLLAADTTVEIDGLILGKPSGAEEAREMLERLSGREHRVTSGLFAARTDLARQALAVETSRVRFRPLSPAVIREYVESGEPLDKAGAYGLQGRGALFVEGIEGSWSNVVGLPLERLVECLERAGADRDALLVGRLIPAREDRQEPASS